jgi:RNA polymerase sigma-70 factor (ECF subfamily)
MRQSLNASANRENPPRLTVVQGGGVGKPAGQSAGPSGSRIGSDRDSKFREIYEAWFNDVVKWLYALGAPGADTEDLAQEIFLVVRRQLSRFRGGNLAGWLYEISRRTVRDHRRRAWFKNLVLRRQEIDFTQVPNTSASPARSYEHAESRRLFQSLVARMSEKLRTAFVLFEIEGYSGEEIARIQDIPLGTVWTRLHHARKEFWKLVQQHMDAQQEREETKR